jgi:exodeoxyribonuclease VII small subunit|tara:strand:+ start:555 stop:800 length:246 start_codon:yes stop_codon:yes gene_type:complete
LEKQFDEINGINNLSFEQALKMLEETVEKLEDGGLTLNETTDMYEQGMKLSQICTNILKSTEVKITEIQTKYSDEMSSSDQ